MGQRGSAPGLEGPLALVFLDEWHAHGHVLVQRAAAGILQLIRLGSLDLCEPLADGGIYRQWAVGTAGQGVCTGFVQTASSQVYNVHLLKFS